MAFQMIHADQRLSERERENLAVRHSNKQRPNQSRSVRHGHGVHILQRNVRLLDCFANDRNDLPQMLARGELRHHAAVLAVNLRLRRDHARKDSPAIGYDRRRRLVAGRFNAQDQMFVRMFFYAHTHASILTVAQNRYVSICKKARPVLAGHPEKI